MKKKLAAGFLLCLLMTMNILSGALCECLSRDAELFSQAGGGQSLGVFASGTALEVLETSGNVCRVRIGSGRGEVTGYVSSSAVSQGSGSPGGQAWIRSPYHSGAINLRSRASDSYEVVGVLDDGEGVTLLGRCNGFCYVATYSGRYGWVTAAEAGE